MGLPVQPKILELTNGSTSPVPRGAVSEKATLVMLHNGDL